MAINPITGRPGCNLHWSTVACVLMGFLIAYVLFFIHPVILNSEHAMQYIRYVPAKNPIGCDLQLLHLFSKSWFIDKHTPYVGSLGLNPYPPLTTVLYTPSLLFEFSTVYCITTILTLCCFFFASFFIPVMFCKIKTNFSLLFFFLFVGLFSYPLHFELERGQFNAIAFVLSALAIYLFHYHPRWRGIAYLLFSVSVQLKLFPIVLILLFVEEWSAWRSNIKRLMGILVFNVALFFILGYRIFLDFLRSIQKHAFNPDIVVTNLSIKSFVTLFVGEMSAPLHLNPATRNMLSWVLNLVLLILVVLCILFIVLKAIRQKRHGLDPNLFLACTIGALLIPSTSHDYKLTVLGAPMAIFLYCISSCKNPRKQLLSAVLLFVISVAYSTTMFSFTNKPHFLQNNLPALMVILVSLTLLAMLRNTKYDSKMMPHTGIKKIRGGIPNVASN